MSTLRTLSENKAPEGELKTTERKAILEATLNERSWWKQPQLRYPKQYDQEKAIRDGELVKVSGPTKYYAMPSYIRADERLQYLRPSALGFLTEVMEELGGRK